MSSKKITPRIIILSSEIKNQMNISFNISNIVSLVRGKIVVAFSCHDEEEELEVMVGEKKMKGDRQRHNQLLGFRKKSSIPCQACIFPLNNVFSHETISLDEKRINTRRPLGRYIIHTIHYTIQYSWLILTIR